MEIRVQSSPWYKGVEVAIFNIDNVVVDISMQKRENNCVINPILTLSMESAQTLMDDLWHTGLRPTEGRGSAGQLAVTERHLADMQRLVFKK